MEAQRAREKAAKQLNSRVFNNRAPILECIPETNWIWKKKILPQGVTFYAQQISWVDSGYIPRLVTCASATGVFIHQKCVAFMHHTVKIINLL